MSTKSKETIFKNFILSSTVVQKMRKCMEVSEEPDSYGTTLGMKSFACNVCFSMAMSPLFASSPALLIPRGIPKGVVGCVFYEKYCPNQDQRAQDPNEDHQKLLDKCIYDYFVKKGMHETAEAFANETDVGKPTNDGADVKKVMPETAEAFTSEADVKNPTDDAIESPKARLAEWWDMFYGMFSSNQAAQDPYAEAVLTMDNVVPQVPYAVPASSAHSATPAQNISPVVPAFSPEKSQEQCYPRTPDDEVTSNLRFLEMDRPIQRSPFVTDPSRLMEQIPYMPQQWDARMEPNANTTTRKAMLPVPDPSEAGSSTGSCSGMKQTP